MSEQDRQFIAKAADVSGESAATFSFRDQHGILADGFVIRTDGVLHAYRNMCRHQPISLDYGDGDFFTEDGKLLICRNHGALFEPGTGKCVAGPCSGAHLFSLPVIEENGDIYLLPGELESPDLE